MKSRPHRDRLRAARINRLRAARILALGALSLLAAPPARAWNATGHMAVAAVAYDGLTPKTRAAVDALLMRQRDYGLWMSKMPAGYTDRARFAFMEAATWPDDVRKTPDDRPIWHYADVPVVAPGYHPDAAAILPVLPNAETQIPAEARLLSDPRATDGQRAVALCWVEHLVGDVHQPLHDASFFSAQFPRGDRGGNSDLLAAGALDGDAEALARTRPKNLHALWDDLLGTTRDPSEVQRIAARLEGPAFARGTYPQLTRDTTARSWVLEGNALARDVAYGGGGLPMSPDGARADVTLPPGYLAAAHRVADRQVALAGLRLADALNAAAFPPVSAAPVSAAPVSAAPPAAPPVPVAPDAVASGPVIGNRRTHLYHVGDDGHLPAERNRVYFQSEDEARKAGYHRSGGQ